MEYERFEDERSIQHGLLAAYRECWWRLMDALENLSTDDMDKLSNPFLIKPLSAYNKARRKVLFVGKETNGWDYFRDTLSQIKCTTRDYQREEIIEFLQWMYEDFRMRRKYDHTPFWRGARRLYQALAPGQGDNSFLNTELVRFSWNNTRPPQRIEKLLRTEYNVLPMEIKALRPDVVIFFTGPDYDELLSETYQNVGVHREPLRLDKIEGFTHRQLVRVVYGELPHHTYRTYHPGFSLLDKKGHLFNAVEEKIAYLVNRGK